MKSTVTVQWFAEHVSKDGKKTPLGQIAGSHPNPMVNLWWQLRHTVASWINNHRMRQARK